MKTRRMALGACFGLIAGVAGLLGTAVSMPAAAQEFPAKPIRLLIPFTPGGGTDFVSRTVGSKLAEVNKWQVVLENMPGASGNLAIAAAAKSAPDGYTIVMGQSDNMMLGPYLYANAGYDTVKSFVPIIQVSETALAIVSNANATQNKMGNVADMVARGKSAAGLSWATAGNGSVGHLFGESLKSAAAVRLLQVPDKGAAPAIADVMGNSVASVIGLVRGGKLTPLAVSTPKRSAMLPNTPTLDEAGIKGIDASIWLGLFAPAGTPPAVVARLNAEINKVLQMPDVREKLINGGVTPMGGTPDEFAAFVRTDYARWGKIVKDSGVKLE